MAHQPKVVTSFPETFQVIENTWITLSDGCRLAARIWLPDSATSTPVPAVLEYLPYRKRDGTAVRDELTYPYYAGHGIAGVRVDMRGNGESEGLMADEYVKQEQDDAVEVIEWIANQDWNNGNVGMMGISWGGFNGLQVAARQPPELKAIITICFTDDRYTDDIHYKGGAMLMENLGWSSTMLGFSSRPPDPELVGDGWKEMWMQRLENMPLLIHNWLGHQHRDAFWQHGSVCEEFGDIKIPVYAIGGWQDAYSNAVPRLLQGLQSPNSRGLIGPWIHKYPHFATPTPAIGFLQDSLDWWNHWLNNQPIKILNNPNYQVYMMDGVLPDDVYDSRPGRWVAHNNLSQDNQTNKTLFLNWNGLNAVPGEEFELSLCSPQDTGTASGEYCAMWMGPELPSDQRYDDAGSIVFDSETLEEPQEIFGAPTVELEISVNRPQANVVVRLCELWPNGESTRITYGVLNLCHRDGHENPVALEPHRKYCINIQLDDIAYRVNLGNRLRVAISTAYWPLIWPSPELVTVLITSGKSKLLIPFYNDIGTEVQKFAEAESTAPLEQNVLHPPSNTRVIERNLGTGETIVRLDDDYGKYETISHGLVSGLHCKETYRINKDDPQSCTSTSSWTCAVSRGKWTTRSESTTTLSCDGEKFFIQANLQAFENEKIVFEKSWNESVERLLV